MTFASIVPLLLMLTADPASQAPVTPPPVVDTARQEGDLRAIITGGSATRDTFVELALLLIQQNRFEDAIAALRGAATAPPPRFSETFDQTMARLQPIRAGGGDIRTPTKLKDVKPVYPPVAQAARVQGIVLIDAVIDEAGRVVNARVLRSIPLLNAAALDAVSQWQFLPNDVDGRPVPVVMTLTVNFVLQ